MNRVVLKLRNKEDFVSEFFSSSKNYDLKKKRIFFLIFGFLTIFEKKIIFCGFNGFFSKLLRLLLKVTGHQKWPKMDHNSIKKLFFCPKGKKKPWPKAEALQRR